MKNKNIALLLLVAFTGGLGVLLFVSGCATIMHGSRQDVGISSAPVSASVTIDNQTMGKTPIVAELRRKDNHIIKIEMAGYEPFETTITHKVSGWVWGNIAFGGLIGLAVDAITGGLYNLTPEQISATLAKGHATITINKDKLYVAVVLKVDPRWRRIGALKRRI